MIVEQTALDDKILGYILRELRHQKQLSLRDLAFQVGIDYSYLCKIETGTAILQPHHLEDLAAYYGADAARFYRVADDFFIELEQVLDANLWHREDRKERRLAFLEKYQDWRDSRYLPYIQFVELENMSYTSIRNQHYLYLIQTLKEDLLVTPYDFFFALRKLYWASQSSDLKRIAVELDNVRTRMPEVSEKYQPYGNYYLLCGEMVLHPEESQNKILYQRAHDGFERIDNPHFSMLSDIVYGANLVLTRKYGTSIQFHQTLLDKHQHHMSPYSQESVYFNMGEAHFILEEYESAFNCYQQAYHLVAQKSTGFFMAFCLMQMGRPVHARRQIDDTLRLPEKNQVMDEWLSWLRRYLRKNDTTRQTMMEKLPDMIKKYQDRMDRAMILVLLRLQADYYHRIQDAEKENALLRELVNWMYER